MGRRAHVDTTAALLGCLGAVSHYETRPPHSRHADYGRIGELAANVYAPVKLTMS